MQVTYYHYASNNPTKPQNDLVVMKPSVGCESQLSGDWESQTSSQQGGHKFQLRKHTHTVSVSLSCTEEIEDDDSNKDGMERARGGRERERETWETKIIYLLKGVPSAQQRKPVR